MCVKILKLQGVVNSLSISTGYRVVINATLKSSYQAPLDFELSVLICHFDTKNDWMRNCQCTFEIRSSSSTGYGIVNAHLKFGHQAPLDTELPMHI